jgi:hypothetical protein
MSTQDPAPKLIDGIFEVVKGRFLWHSYDKEGKGLVSGLTEGSVIRMTHFYLKGLQEGWPEPEKKFAGTVGGKL